jgi:hypothetical protein
MTFAYQSGAFSFFRDFPRMVISAGAFCSTDPCRVRLFSRDFRAMTTEASSLQGSWMPHGTTDERRASAIESDNIVRQLIFALHGTKGTGVQLLQACAGRFRHSRVPGELTPMEAFAGKRTFATIKRRPALFPSATPLAP